MFAKSFPDCRSEVGQIRKINTRDNLARESPTKGGLIIMRIRYTFLALVVVAPFATAGSALAQGTPAQRQGCEGDAFKFCSNYIPFVHAIENCLYRNMRNLTPACRYQMQGGASRRR